METRPTPLQLAYDFAARSGLALSSTPARGVIVVAPHGDAHAIQAWCQGLSDRCSTLGTDAVVPVRHDDLAQAVRASEEDRGPGLRVHLVGLPTSHIVLSADLRSLDLRSLLIIAASLDGGFPAAGGSHHDFVEALDDTRGRAWWTAERRARLAPGPELSLETTPEQSSGEMDHHEVRLSAVTWKQLRTACRRRGVEAETVLLQAYAEIIRRWSKEPAFSLNCVLGELPETCSGSLGQFNLPRIIDVTAQERDCFLERVSATADNVEQQQRLGGYDGIRLQRDLSRDKGAPVVLPVVFSSVLGAPGQSGLRVTQVRTTTPQVWLENQVVEAGDELVSTWHHVADLFAPDTVASMAQAYRELLEALSSDDSHDHWHASFELVPLPQTDAEEQRAANDTSADVPPLTLHELALQGGREHPDRVALIDARGELTHRELQTWAHLLGEQILSDIGPAAGEPLAVICPPGRHQVVAILAVLIAGGAYVPIDPAMPRSRRDDMLSRCGVRAVVSDQPGLQLPQDVKLITVPAQSRTPDTIEVRAARQRLDDLAYIIFTSGSTGAPKGVMISHSNAVNTIVDINRRIDLRPDDRAICLAPAGFDLSVYDLFGLLAVGGAMVIPDPEKQGDPNHWADLVRLHRVTVWNSVPAPVRLLADVLERGADAGTGLRQIMMSGDWIPLDLPDRIRRLFPGCRVLSLGGATEGSIWSISHPIEDVDPSWPSIPYGKALGNQEMWVRNRWGERCPRGVVGEIWIGGHGVSQGYVGDPERTADRFVVDPVTGHRAYRTGDLGCFLRGGDIRILGREDQQVKINGYRVELGEIESCLSEVPGVREAVVNAPVHSGSGQRQIIAYTVGDVAVETLHEACRSRLPAYMVPVHHVKLDAIPLTGNGKLDRARLPLPYHERTGNSGTPVSGLAAEVFEIWAEQLGHREFDTSDGFFDAGGDSLHAVGILRAVRERFGLDASAEQELVESLFMNADVASFCEVVERGAA